MNRQNVLLIKCACHVSTFSIQKIQKVTILAHHHRKQYQHQYLYLYLYRKKNIFNIKHILIQYFLSSLPNNQNMSDNNSSDVSQFSTSTKVQTKSKLNKNVKPRRKRKSIFGGCTKTVTKNSHDIINCKDCVAANKTRVKCEILNCRCTGNGFLFKVGSESESKKFAHQIPSESKSTKIHIDRIKQTHERIAKTAQKNATAAQETFVSANSNGICDETDNSSNDNDDDDDDDEENVTEDAIMGEIEQSNLISDEKDKLISISFVASGGGKPTGMESNEDEYSDIFKGLDDSYEIPNDLADQQIV